MIDIFYHIFDIYTINTLSFDLLRGVLLCRVILTTDDVENVRTAFGLLTTDFAGSNRNWDGVLEEHLRASFESIVILSIIKKKRTKRKSFLWLFQATVAVFKLPLGRE